MATSSKGERTVSARSLKGREGGLELLSPEGSSVYMTEVKVDSDLYDSNPITNSQPKTIIGVPRKTTQVQQENSSQAMMGTGQCVSDQLSELHISKVVAIEGGEESSSDSESETDEGVLHSAGVEFDLNSLEPGPDGKAPLELVSQFLACVMNEDFAAAKLLCEKVMELEPHNELSTEFYPVILERIKLDAELSTESSSSSESESEGEITFVSSGEESSSSSDSESQEEETTTTPVGQDGHLHRHKNCVHVSNSTS